MRIVNNLLKIEFDIVNKLWLYQIYKTKNNETRKYRKKKLIYTSINDYTDLRITYRILTNFWSNYIMNSNFFFQNWIFAKRNKTTRRNETRRRDETKRNDERNENWNETRKKKRRNYRHLSNLLSCWTSEKTRRDDSKNIKAKRDSKTKIKTKIKVKTKTKDKDEKAKKRNENETKILHSCKIRQEFDLKSERERNEDETKETMKIWHILTFWETKRRRKTTKSENQIQSNVLRNETKRENELNASVEAKKKLSWRLSIEATRRLNLTDSMKRSYFIAMTRLECSLLKRRGLDFMFHSGATRNWVECSLLERIGCFLQAGWVVLLLNELNAFFKGAAWCFF